MHLAFSFHLVQTLIFALVYLHRHIDGTTSFRFGLCSQGSDTVRINGLLPLLEVDGSVVDKAWPSLCNCQFFIHLPDDGILSSVFLAVVLFLLPPRTSFGTHFGKPARLHQLQGSRSNSRTFLVTRYPSASICAPRWELRR